MAHRAPGIFTALRSARLRPLRMAIGSLAASAMLTVSLLCMCLGTAHGTQREQVTPAPTSHHCHDMSGSEQQPKTHDTHSPFCPHCNTGQLTAPQSVAISIPVVVHHIDFSWPLAVPAVPVNASDMAVISDTSIHRWRTRIPIDNLLSPLAQSGRLII